MEIDIPIEGGNYTYIIDNVSKDYIETIELKYNILQKYFKNKNKSKLNESDKLFYIKYLMTIFNYLDYCKCPLEKGVYKDLTLLVNHLEDCYYNNNFEYNKNQILKQTNLDNLLKDALLYLLKQFDKSCNKNLSLPVIKKKLINHLETVKDKKILTKILNYKTPSIDIIELEKKINTLHKKHNIKYIKDISLNNSNIIKKLDKLINYVIELNNIYKNYIIELEKYNINIINEIYKLKF